MTSTLILTGFHAVLARLRHAPHSIKEIYLDHSRHDGRMRTLINLAEDLEQRIHRVAGQRLDELAQGLRHQGVVALSEKLDLSITIEEVLDEIEGAPLLLVLDGVTDPHNLGACLRCADAAGVHAVIAPRDHAVGLNSTVERIACGAAQAVPYIMVTNLARTLRILKERGIWLVGTDDQSTISLYDVDANQPMAWIMGAEGKGMRRLTRQTCDINVHIPMKGLVESLNVSVASAICLYESVRQRLITST